MNERNAAAPAATPREPYAVPALARLGTLAELTHRVANKKNADGGKGSLKRSQ